MNLVSRTRGALRNLFSKRQGESQLEQEVKAYVDMMTDERIAAGMPATEARRTALADFGGVEQVKQAVRERRTGAGLELLWQDVRYGWRQLGRNRSFTLTAIITLGLGIGATTAIFSAVYSLLLRPLPYHDANRLVSLSSVWPNSQSEWVLDPDFVSARFETKSFEQLAGFHIITADNLTGSGGAMRVIRACITANFLPTLGVVPQLGRNLSPEDDWSGGANVVLLSDRLWRKVFHGDSGVIGKLITLNGAKYMVIGVMPRYFSFPSLNVEPDLYGSAILERDRSVSIEKPIFGINVVARLRPGVSIEQAQAEMRAYFQARAKGYPVGLAPFAKDRQVMVETLQRHIAGDNRKPLCILLLSVAAVLLIACANVANLQLARAVARAHETALRNALGASRLRLMRQFLVESLVLSSLAAGLGLFIAIVVTSLIRQAGMLEGPQASHIGRVAQLLRMPFGKMSAVIQVDGWVLAFTVGLALFTTFLFGLAPAVTGTRAGLRNALQSAALGISSGREQRLLRHALLVVQVGVAVVLLASAGLLIRSFVNVMSYESGFDPSNTLIGVTALHTGVASLSSPSTAWSGEHALSFVDQVLLRLQALPGVTAVAATTFLPLDPIAGRGAILHEGVPVPPLGNRSWSCATEITPDYFRTVGTPLLTGRVFTSADNQTSLPVAIVNRTFARQYFAGDALAKRFRTSAGERDPNHFTTWTIVGVVEDVRRGGLQPNPQPEIFRPIAQFPITFTLKLLLRTLGNPALLANAMRAAVAAVDREQPLFDVETMDQRVGDMVADRRLVMLLIACFAILAVVLCAVGVFGVFAYSVSRRSREMGIRLALGASRGALLRLVVNQAAQVIALGGVLGLGAAWVLTKLLASMLVGITQHDILSFSLAWVFMTVVALLASTIPAAHAARTDLVTVLRSE